MAKKVLLIVFGVVLALIGVVLTVGGAVLLALTGGDGYFGSGSETLQTPTHALVSESVADYADSEAGGLAAKVRVTASSTSGAPLFLGVGRTADVDRYLSGVAYDEVRDIRFSPFRYDTVRRDGEQTPEPPTDQSGWIARAAGGGEQTLEFEIRDQNDYRLVVMNADGSAGVEVRASFGIRLPFLRRLGLGLVIGGVLAVLVGIALLVLGVRVRVPPRQPPGRGPYGGGYGPPAYGYPPPGQAPPPGYPGGPPGYPYPPPPANPPPAPTARPADPPDERPGPEPGATGAEPGFDDPTRPPQDGT